MAEVSATSREFLLKEYEALHRKMDMAMQEQLVIARWAMVFTGAFWAGLAIAQPGWLPGMAYLTPAIFVAMLIIRTVTLQTGATRLRKYLLSVESYMELPGVLGWEKQRAREGITTIRVLCWVYWILLLVINVAVATIYIPMIRGG
jgi:hypothetical protein